MSFSRSHLQSSSWKNQRAIPHRWNHWILATWAKEEAVISRWIKWAEPEAAILPPDEAEILLDWGHWKSEGKKKLFFISAEENSTATSDSLSRDWDLFVSPRKEAAKVVTWTQDPNTSQSGAELWPWQPRCEAVHSSRFSWHGRARQHPYDLLIKQERWPKMG